MARLELARRAEDAVLALGLVQLLHHLHVLVHGGGDLEAVLVEQVLPVHRDEDRDVERHADHLVAVHADAVDQRLREVGEVVAGHRQLGVLVLLARVDAVVDEGGRPGLVEIVEIIGAELALHVERRLLQHLLERHDLDLDIDAGDRGELVLGDLVGDDRGRRGLGGVADRGALELGAHVLQPLRDLLGLLVQRPAPCSCW